MKTKAPQINTNTPSIPIRRVLFSPNRLVAVLLPLLLLQVAPAVVEEEVHVLRQGPLNNASGVVEEVHKLFRVQDLEFFLLGQLVGGRCKGQMQTEM